MKTCSPELATEIDQSVPIKLFRLFFPVKRGRSSDRSVFQPHFNDLFVLQIAQIFPDRYMRQVRQTGDVVYGETAFLLVDASHDHDGVEGVSPLSMASSSFSSGCLSGRWRLVQLFLCDRIAGMQQLLALHESFDALFRSV